MSLTLKDSSAITFVIPAYCPSNILRDIVQNLRLQTTSKILVIDDGSGPQYQELFQEISRIHSTVVLTHAVNQGKGAALKSAANEVLRQGDATLGIVTLDADGQHAVVDVIAVAKRLELNPESLVLGCREFDPTRKVPLRSRIGNLATRKVFSFLTGIQVTDTQTGLRGIPSTFLRDILRIPSNGYDFEMDMLILATQQKRRIQEVPIKTIYIDGNASSHFNPITDSIRIYFTFARFLASSLLTSLIDYIAFGVFYSQCHHIFWSLLGGRIIACAFNFTVSKRFVFKSQGSFYREVLKYGLLVLALLFFSNISIQFLTNRLHWPILLAKIMTESSFFLVSFSVQRILVFNRSIIS